MFTKIDTSDYKTNTLQRSYKLGAKKKKKDNLKQKETNLIYNNVTIY